jgi:hypothetical protein
MAKTGRKKGSKIEKISLHGAKVSSAFRIDKIERLVIIDKVAEVYGTETGYTSLIPQLLLDHLKVTPEDIEARRQKFIKTGK